jgi:hypothetical protein
MTGHRWHWIPISLVVGGVVLVCAAAAVNFRALGWWELLIVAGCALAVAAAFWFRHKLSAVEIELEALRQRLADDETRLNTQRSEFEQLRLTIQSELAQEASRLDKREQNLTQRLVTYREWMEFPQPLEMASPAAPSPELSELAKKDRQMLELLQAETKLLYDNILQNKYASGDQILLPVIRDDMLVLITKVARIYQPGIEHPFIDASLARIFRATSRASLQMLVILDELPLNVKDASLITLYNYVRRAVSAWQTYKSTEPYWPYVNAAYYVSRFALGANPISLGAWWFVSTLGSRGAQAIAQHVINRQALAVLSNVVRVIGFEVAGLYGGDFRHRDANWIYAAELTELLGQFPLSRDSLAHALREVGTLQLRSEYDRTFLYRCLAGRKSAGPAQYHAAGVLTMDERRAIATRLERFLQTFIHGKSAEKISRWKAGAEQRLDLKISVALVASTTAVREQIVDAIRSLTSFLVAIKELDPPQAVKLLEKSLLAGELAPDDRQRLLAELAQNASFFFEHPDLDPDGDLVEKYLDDLAALHARTAPHDARIEETLDDVAAYLRRSPKRMQALVEKHYAAALAERLAADAPLKRVPMEVTRAALDLLSVDGEQARFLYGPAKLDWSESIAPAELAGSELWLLGAGQQLTLFAAGDQPRVVWRAAVGEVHAEHCRQMLVSSCRLTGGQWMVNGQTQPLAIRLPTSLVSTYTGYFKPLLSMLGGAVGSDGLGRTSTAS